MSQQPKVKKESEFRTGQKKVKSTGMLGHFKLKPGQAPNQQQLDAYLAAGRRHSADTPRVLRERRRPSSPPRGMAQQPPPPRSMDVMDIVDTTAVPYPPPAVGNNNNPWDAAMGRSHPYRRPSGEGSMIGLDLPPRILCRRRSLPVNIREGSVHIDRNNLQLPEPTVSAAANAHTVKPELVRMTLPYQSVPEQLPSLMSVMSLIEKETRAEAAHAAEAGFPMPTHFMPPQPPSEYYNHHVQEASCFEFPPRTPLATTTTTTTTTVTETFTVTSPATEFAPSAYEFPPRNRHNNNTPVPPTTISTATIPPTTISTSQDQIGGYTFPARREYSSPPFAEMALK